MHTGYQLSREKGSARVAHDKAKSLLRARDTNTRLLASVERTSRDYTFRITRFETTSLLCPKKNKPKTLSGYEILPEVILKVSELQVLGLGADSCYSQAWIRF